MSALPSGDGARVYPDDKIMLPLSASQCVGGKWEDIYLYSCNQSLYSSVAERQSCELKVLGSIPSEGYARMLA